MSDETAGLVVRPYTDADWPAVWRIVEPVVRAGETYPEPPDLDEAAARHWWIDSHRTVFVAADATDGTLLGTYYLTDNKPGQGAHVANAGFMVAAAAQGRGVGRAMGEHSLQAARDLGYLAMQFNMVAVTNEASLRIWDALGFTKVGLLPRAFRHPRLGLVDAWVLYRWLGD